MATRWQDVHTVLKGYLADGQWKAGDRVPPEPELAAQLGVSRATLREALRALNGEGLITRTRGAGTFVSQQPRLANHLDVNTGVTALIRAMGRTPGTRTLNVFDGTPNATEQEALNLELGDPVVVVERVRTADGKPVVFSRDVYPQSVLPGQSEDLQRLTGVSIYDFLETYCGISIEYGIARINAAAADERLAAALDVPVGAPVMSIEQTDYDSSSRPVLHSNEFHLAEAFEFSLVRRGGRAAGPSPVVAPDAPVVAPVPVTARRHRRVPAAPRP